MASLKELVLDFSHNIEHPGICLATIGNYGQTVNLRKRLEALEAVQTERLILADKAKVRRRQAKR
jgi:putative ubiquitin-RnfH superfamily antitoxin RatB of RatAB toxin-antitoxin module